jgi:hypothetical protein
LGTLLLILPIALIPLMGGTAQDRPSTRYPVEAAPIHGFNDWSMQHGIYPRSGPMAGMLAAQRDPRAAMVWDRQFGGRRGRGWPLPPSIARPAQQPTHRDWSIYLGANGTAPAMYPAKFSFDVTAAPSCSSDFVVFPINATGSGSQPNIVAFNQLYSGTAPTGICNRTPSGTDSGTAAEIYWSYNVEGISGGGAVTTSPALSYDSNGTGTGMKVAFVESGSGSAHFHVLAWKSGDGKDSSNFQSVGLGEILSYSIATGGSGYHVNDTGTILGGSTLATYTVTSAGGAPTRAVTGITITSVGAGYSAANGVATTSSRGGASGFTVNITSVGSPKTISSFSPTTPAIGSGTATDLAFGSSTDTLSSPFIDYVHDTAYVGNDAGQLYRIKDVFCMGISGGDSACTSESSGPAPGIDTSWGSGGYVQVCGGKLTGPDLDSATGNVFVGCSDGKLYSISQQGQVTSLQVGDGTTYGGIVDPPSVDGVDGFVYAVSGAGSASGGASGVLVQAKTTNLSSYVAASIGLGRECNLHDPTPNNAYLTSITSSGALVYIGGLTTTGTVTQPCTAASTGSADVELWAVTFGSGGVMSSGTPAHGFDFGGGDGREWGPLLEFYNATTGADWIFMSALQSGQADIAGVNVAGGFQTNAGNYTLATEGVGTSGMVVDNDSSSGQASSIYFNALQENASCSNNTNGGGTGGCAVKLTQGALQ